MTGKRKLPSGGGTYSRDSSSGALSRTTKPTKAAAVRQRPAAKPAPSRASRKES